jgi:hypothetical protein
MKDNRRMVELTEEDQKLATELGHGDLTSGVERILAWARIRIAWLNDAGEGLPGFIAEITDAQTPREQELAKQLYMAQRRIAELEIEVENLCYHIGEMKSFGFEEEALR